MNQLDDPGDFQDRERERQKALQRDSVSLKRELRNLRWLMSGPQGRRVVWDVLVASSAFTQEVVPNAAAMWGYEGARLMGMRWLNLLHHQPDLFRLYPLMVNENLHNDDEARNADRELSAT